MTETFTSGAGLPASTVQENSASSPSFTTSFSGLTLITGFTAGIMLVKKRLHFLDIITHDAALLIVDSDCENGCHFHLCDRGIGSPPSTLASGWGKLIKEASLTWVLPSHFGKYSGHLNIIMVVITILLNEMPKECLICSNAGLGNFFGGNFIEIFWPLLCNLQKIKLARALCPNGLAR